MPDRFSFRYALMRANRMRWLTNETRILDRKKNVSPSDHWQGKEDHDGQARVEEDEHGRGAGQQENVAEHRNDALREQVGQRINVVRQASHQSPYRIAVEIRERQRFEVGEKLYPQISHRTLADDGDKQVLAVAQEDARDQHEEVDRAQLRNPQRRLGRR